MPAAPPRSRLAPLCALVLVAAVLVTYTPVREHAFVTWDDPGYVADNPHVRDGFTADGLAWAFTESHMANWHPLTWLSHMLDWELFGDDAGAHHLMSVLLHALAAALLLLALQRLTGSLAVAVVAATLFALHPLRVESVAWASERKDVLSAVFFAAVLLAWERYVRAPSRDRYGAVLALFVLGLLAKPMLVTLPALLLLLDVWPLGRVARWRGLAPRPAAPAKALRRAAEIAPLLLLAALSAWITVGAQDAGRAVQSLESAPLDVRLATAPLSVLTYLRQTVWPSDLAFFHPHPAAGATQAGLPLPLAGALAALALLVLTLGLLRRALRGRPELLVGWLWFVGLLVPVLGLVQVGVQGTADRYTYLPGIGLGLMLGCLVQSALVRRPAWRAPALALGAALGLVLCLATRAQLATWKDSETLYTHALTVTEGNDVAHILLGAEYLAQGRLDEAAEQCDAALALRPDHAKARYNRGLVAALQGDDSLAAEHLRVAVAARPDLATPHATLGAVLFRLDDLSGARRHLRRALQLDPTDTASAMTLNRLQRRTEAGHVPPEPAPTGAPAAGG